MPALRAGPLQPGGRCGEFPELPALRQGRALAQVGLGGGVAGVAGAWQVLVLFERERCRKPAAIP